MQIIQKSEAVGSRKKSDTAQKYSNHNSQKQVELQQPTVGNQKLTPKLAKNAANFKKK